MHWVHEDNIGLKLWQKGASVSHYHRHACYDSGGVVVCSAGILERGYKRLVNLWCALDQDHFEPRRGSDICVTTKACGGIDEWRVVWEWSPESLK
jgi:hypothetical protein